MIHNQVFIAFVDCTVKGDWKGIRPPVGITALIKQALNDDDCTVSVFQIDTVRRNLFFKKGAEINIVNNVLMYNSLDADELTVDEYQAKYHGNDNS